MAEEPTGAYRTETIFLLSLVVLTILFLVTGFAAQMYHAKEKALGEEWNLRGSTDLKDGQPEKAIVDFRTALVYYRENDACELSLAKALLAAKHVEEARAHLTRLWERHPESGEVNLELGRLATQNADIDQALRYFHNSIYGNWEQGDAPEQRRKARLELYQFLTSKGANMQAQGELMALAAELPPDSQLHIQVGSMFLTAKDYTQAEKQFLQALQLSRNEKNALEGAGEVEFESGDYWDAQVHLERAIRQDPHNTQVAGMLDTTRLVLSIDPSQSGLSAREQNSRITRAFKQALTRLQQCAEIKGERLDDSRPLTPLRDAYDRGADIKSMVQEKLLNRDPETVTTVLAWVTEAENLAATTCGAPTGLDEAIILALRKHEGNPK